MRQIKPDIQSFARIRVVGTGGSGCNAVNHMITSKVKGVDFVVINTDAQDLHHSLTTNKVHIGKDLTRGLGSGMSAEIGKRAAEENIIDIQDALKGSDMVFVTCGLGGGTGTGSAPVISRAAREAGALTVAVVTLPFSFEGQHRMAIAEAGLAQLRSSVDAIIVISNDKILETVEKDTGMKDAFAYCDNVLKNAVEGISDLITKQGLINVDFADIRTIMQSSGSALMGIGEANGEGRAKKAAMNAINSPLLNISIEGATGILVAISGKDDLSLHEAQDAVDTVTKEADANAKIIFGTLYDSALKKGEIKVTVIATGFGDKYGPSRIGRSMSHDVMMQPQKHTPKPSPAQQTSARHNISRAIHNSLPTFGRKGTVETNMQQTDESNEHAVQKKTNPLFNDIKTRATSDKDNLKPKKISIETTDDDDDDDGFFPSIFSHSKLR